MKSHDELDVKYRYVQSGKRVVRHIQLPGGRTVSSRLKTYQQADNSLDASSAFDYRYLRLSAKPHRRSSNDALRVLDLFSGCGGLSLGVSEACSAIGVQFIAVGAVDYNSKALDVYRNNFLAANTYHQDVGGLLDGEVGAKPTKIERRFLSKILPLDLVLAGPPCQGHSDLNNHTRRDDERNILYEKVARLVELAHPEHVIIENVPAAVHGKHRAVMKSIEAMKNLGYNVEHGLVSLVELGVPQRRKRHIVVASVLPIPPLKEIVEKHKVDTIRTVRWAIEDLEDEPENGILTKASRHTKENRRRIDYLHDNGIYELPNSLRPPCHRHKRHTYKAMYGRILYDKPSQTITSGFTSPGQGRFIHPVLRRTLTPHEAARLQFFPDYFNFLLARTRTSLAQIIGNAVPMKLPFIISLELLGLSMAG